MVSCRFSLQPIHRMMVPPSYVCWFIPSTSSECIHHKASQPSSEVKILRSVQFKKKWFGERTISMGIPGSWNGGTSVPYFWPYFAGVFPENSAWKIGLIYGRYLQSRFLKWPLTIWLCLKIGCSLFQWMITIFPKLASCGSPFCSDKPIFLHFSLDWIKGKS